MTSFTPSPQQLHIIENVEEIRRSHIKTEASIKTLGYLYYFGGFLIIVVPLWMLISSMRSGAAISFGELAIASLIIGSLGFLYFSVGKGLIQFKKWARIVAIILAFLSILKPRSILFSLYFLSLLFSEKGKTIFSEDYQKVISATPHIKYKTPKSVWILLIALVSLIVVLAIGAVLATK